MRRRVVDTSPVPPCFTGISVSVVGERRIVGRRSSVSVAGRGTSANPGMNSEKQSENLCHRKPKVWGQGSSFPVEAGAKARSKDVANAQPVENSSQEQIGFDGLGDFLACLSLSLLCSASILGFFERNTKSPFHQTPSNRSPLFHAQNCAKH